MTLSFDKQISAGNYNIMIQYIHSIRDKAIHTDLKTARSLQKLFLALVI